MARKLVLLTYNLKPGTDLAEYEDYTRNVDYRAFRQNPRIQDYANFVISRNVRGEEWFKHFDLMYVDDHDAYHADGKLHYGDPVILNHAAEWRDRWAKDDASGWRGQVNISYADEIWG
ncbi:hypothetical protein [Nonomuraea cavernae]|uniref:Uncharacterized protein n=1 Tax=Nonomuraea cavernae TaxID=2045107 RepID=A0A917Z255_9ACTN|nr:hypothetical protein [Nonomuraea cavernae]MCA2187932.1 hypothetical protein [Nonomuraea cavernae]GGO72286.1 hypothetical protein GCM10012289_39980 [Nonomuraea cavernae]